MTGFTPLLRLAWRDLWRNKGRSLVVFLMILLPVLGVSAASTVIATASVTGSERVVGDMGTADIVLGFNGNNDNTVHAVDVLPKMEGQVRAALGAGTATALRAHGTLRASTDKGATRVDAYEADLANPLLTGTYRLVSGHLPRVAGQVAVNGWLADRGPGVGETLEVRGGSSLRVVGIVEDPFEKDSGRAWGRPGELIPDRRAPGSVGDVTVFAKAAGALDLRRLADLGKDGYYPTTRDQDVANYSGGRGLNGPDLAVFVLVVVMALTEVALLAGPAFAVSARRRQRELALLSANGGTPRQVRAAVLTTAFVIGGLAAAVGAAGGVLVGWLVSPVAEQFGSTWFGPRDWSPLQVAGVALFGLVSAVLAALVPSWLASRQDVVRVLAGRRGDPAPARFSPLLGIVLMVIGGLLTFVGLVGASSYGEIWIGFGAVTTVLGAVALMPLILRLLARSTGRAPLAVRYALRDGLRHRTRTVPAIGAVMATVAGVVALGIANASQEAAGEKTYEPRLPMGHAEVNVWSDYGATDDVAKQWTAVVPVLKRLAPDAVVVRGMADEGGQSIMLRGGGDDLYGDFSGPFNNGVAVASKVPAVDFGLSQSEVEQADAVLARGGAVVMGRQAGGLSHLTLVRYVDDSADAQDADGMKEAQRLRVPAVAFAVKGRPLATAIVADRAAERLGARVSVAGALINRTVSTAEAKTLEEAVLDVADGGDVYVERGWQPDPEYALMMLVLMVVGALLMVGGTVTATVLALADAGPDLGTLSAVGAAPRTSRAVAMGIAFVIGGVGAVLGVVVGAVPGIAVTWPMTSHAYYYGGSSGSAHTIDIPWLLLAEVAVGVPVLLALVVGLCARSRLPLVARID
ncbi:hypothetical protein GCM10011584_17490 [Nocardioides phosphati]|uniref:ABC3 transporter permease C-terminal domain-containing protein n=1 Tax=Nocardioides phosphati TaxID=1867775 RepID=A0ABQ2NA44_9ACTN|nr:FtsX-like permease family protein [Nocardioides phosphati]GGO89039.1 hypothetical protein GCM10011584_17490 [Nocardioides phosphati]